jgi:hypothetical protein
MFLAKIHFLSDADHWEIYLIWDWSTGKETSRWGAMEESQSVLPIYLKLVPWTNISPFPIPLIFATTILL